MSLASPTRINRSLDGWKAIELVVDYTHAIGRIGCRGSCILLSIPVPANTAHNNGPRSKAVILTTSFVLQNREEAQGLTATFLEQPVTGSGAKGITKPVEVALRGDVMFVCSARAPPKRLIDYIVEDHTHMHTEPAAAGDGGGDDDVEEDVVQVEELGYTILACDLDDVSRDPKRSLRSITPLPLPLVLDTVPDVKLGDVHLIVTHENSASRRYIIAVVKEVFEHHCTYDFVDPTCQFASGGSVFSQRGDFIGMQHQCGDSSYCIYIRDVVSHLFESGMLGLCRIPVLSANTEDARDEEGELNPNAAIRDEEFNEAFQFTQRSRLMDVGAGDQLISFEELQIVKQRKASGRVKSETVRVKRHSEVWDYWTNACGTPGTAEYYRGLILLLAAFPFQANLCIKIMTELTSHQNRQLIPSVSSYGGIGYLLEALDSHPHNEALVQTAVTSLARVSLYDANRRSIIRSDGVPVIIGVMREFMLCYDIQQWAFYMLMNLLQEDDDEASQCSHAIMKYAGLEVMLQSISRHETGVHLQRWGWHSIGLVLRRTLDSGNATYLIFDGLGGVALAVSRLETFWKDTFVAPSIAFALHSLMRIDERYTVTSTSMALSVRTSLMKMRLPAHEHQLQQPPPTDSRIGYDEPMSPAEIAAAQTAAHQQRGCCLATSMPSLLIQAIQHHLDMKGATGSGSLVEYLLVLWLDLLTSTEAAEQQRPNSWDLGAPESRDLQEAVIARATEVHMTETRMHTVAEKILKYLGVVDPHAKYSHLQRDRNPLSFKEL